MACFAKFGASDMCLKFLWILSLKVGNFLENFNVLSSCGFQCYNSSDMDIK